MSQETNPNISVDLPPKPELKWAGDYPESANIGSKPSCKTCRFFINGVSEVAEKYKKDHGECRRQPPKINLALNESMRAAYEQYGTWPLVIDIDWCGEHQPR